MRSDSYFKYKNNIIEHFKAYDSTINDTLGFINIQRTLIIVYGEINDCYYTGQMDVHECTVLTESITNLIVAMSIAIHHKYYNSENWVDKFKDYLEHYWNLQNKLN